MRPLGQAESATLIAWLITAVALAGMVGCGPKSELLGVSGEVSLDRTPLKSGSIRFTLTGSEKVLSAGASIKDGQYSIPQAKGLSPGTYHIAISAVDENSPMVTIKDASGNPLTSAPAELIPPEYNTNSEKTVDVSPDGENQFSFDIVNK